jgi:glycosyltransferase involved in cell wall biosynthesis
MKILFITHKFYPDIGGIEVNSEILALAFHEAGHEVRLVTWTKESGEKEFPFVVIRNPDKLTLYKEHKNCSVVFENNPSLRLSWPALLFNKVIVVALRTWINRNEGGLAWQDKFKLLWLKRAKAVIAVSEAVRKRCWPEAVVIGNPYRKDLFRVLPDIGRIEGFVFMGRLVPDKGVHIALEALHQLSVLNPNTKNLTFTIIGGGPEQQRLEKLTKDLNLTNRVTFTGALKGDALVSCLNKHRYLLVPSTWEEPFGNVALEGMACGCLPIVSDGGGLPDAVGDAGLVVKRNDALALAEGIQSLLSNTAMESKLRMASSAHLTNHYPEVVSRRYLDVVEKAVELKRKR